MSEDVRPTTHEPLANPAAALPDDPAILRQMILELLDALRDTRRQNDELQHRLDLLLRRLYGPRTERFDPRQPLLIPDAFEPVAPEIGRCGPARSRAECRPRRSNPARTAAGPCPRTSGACPGSTC